MMTKRDYIKIAEVLKQNYEAIGVWDESTEPDAERLKNVERAVLDNIIDDLSLMLWQDNPRFDRARFTAACKGLE